MLSQSDISSAAYMAHRARKMRLSRKRVREPVSSYPPSVTIADGVATIHTGGWTGSPTFAFQWLDGGEVIQGATQQTYTIQNGDDLLSCCVTASNDGGSSVVTSAAVAVE